MAAWEPGPPSRAHHDAVTAPLRPVAWDPGPLGAAVGRGAAGRGAQPRRFAELCVQTLGVTGAGISMVTDTGNRGSCVCDR